MKAWVQFSALKAAVTMESVLRHYHVDWLRPRAKHQLHGRCPIHRGKNPEAFQVHLGKNVFHCFSCQAQGDILDFVAAMERCSVREAALKLQDWFGVRSWPPPPAGSCQQNSERVRKKEGGNQPLPFALSPVNPSHPYLAGRGILPSTAADFGVGFFAGPGLLSGRIVFPIHDECARLVAYAGRSVDGALPRYKLPAGFQKGLVLYNLHRAVASGQDTVIMVEGFFDCLKVHQAGMPCVIALMGSILTEGQRELLLPRFRRVVLMLDGDQTGRAASGAIRARLASDCSVRVVELPPGEQPDRLPAPVLRQLVSRFTYVSNGMKHFR